jgi:hypothetical protein
MKSLLITLFLVTAGMLSFTNAQVRSQSSKNEAFDGRNPLDFLFPDFQRDISALQAKEVKNQPDKSITSTPIENRIFTNYTTPVTRINGAARAPKSSATKSALPSDASSTDAANKVKAAQAANTVKPVIVPNQGSEPNNIPVKKKS